MVLFIFSPFTLMNIYTKKIDIILIADIICQHYIYNIIQCVIINYLKKLINMYSELTQIILQGIQEVAIASAIFYLTIKTLHFYFPSKIRDITNPTGYFACYLVWILFSNPLNIFKSFFSGFGVSAYPLLVIGLLSLATYYKRDFKKMIRLRKCNSISLPYCKW